MSYSQSGSGEEGGEEMEEDRRSERRRVVRKGDIVTERNSLNPGRRHLRRTHMGIVEERVSVK